MLIESEILFVIILLLNIGGIVVAYFRKHDYYFDFAHIFGANILSIIANVAIQTSPSVLVIRMAESAYYASMLCIFLAMYHLLANFVVHGKIMVKMFRGFFLLALIDYALLTVNIFHDLMFRVSIQPSSDSMQNIVTADNIFPMYLYHLLLCYALGICICVSVIIKSIISRGIYRIRYITVAVMVASEGIVGFFNRGNNLNSEVILLMLTIIALMTYYLISFFVPQLLLNRTIGETLKDLNNGLVVLDLDGNLVLANDISYRLLRLPVGREIEMHKKIDEFIETRNLDKKETDEWTIENLDCVDELTHIRVHQHIINDRHGHFIGRFFTFIDQTEDYIKIAQEHYKTTHDSLTGLYNREGFYEAVRRKLDANPNKTYYMACSNIRDFKMINDLFGYEKGNDILKRLVSLVSREQAVEGGSIFGRIFADRFALLIPDDFFDVEYLAKRMKDTASLITSNKYTLIIDAGIYQITDSNMDVSMMCDRANIAIKANNRPENSVTFYEDNMMDDMLKEREEALKIEQSINNGEFLIYLQPQNRADGSLLGAEALVRWNNPEHGILPPGAFLNILEKYELLHKLDAYVWELAAKQLADWKGTFMEQYHISVNISPKDFYYLDIYKTFVGLATNYQIDPGKLNLEITESAMMHNPEHQLEIIAKLHDYGFHIELDDFGSGYSSMNMLKDLPADVLKIDMEFLRETENKERSRQILSSIISLAKALDMEVITEGVEKHEQIEPLSKMGCQIFQGYYFSKPIPVDDFEAKYSS